MITKLQLVNFKQHENLTINFGEGLIAIKGANEAGKSTIFQASVYADFGARALPLTLAETVTYDKSESSLRVEKDFTFEGVSYNIVRSKAGAKLVGGGVEVNGQAEVTKFMENLYGVNAETASKLMVASQNSLRGALEGSGAVPLIEKLANIDMVDTLITKVQEQLPCGTTKQLAAAIEELQTVVEPDNNLSTYQPAITDAKDEVALQTETIRLTEVDIAALDLNTAICIIEQDRNQTSTKRHLEMELVAIEAGLAVPPVHFSTDIDELRTKSHAQTMYAEKVKALKLLRESPSPTEFFSEDVAAKIKELSEFLADRKEEAFTLSKLQITTSSLRISDTACGLCGKLLQEVPEVVTKNATIDQELVRLDTKLADNQRVTEAAVIELVRLQNLKALDAKLALVEAKISKYVTASSTMPRVLKWSAGVISDAPDTTDYAGQIADAEMQRIAATRAQATWDSLKARKIKTEESILALNVVYAVSSARAILDSHQALRSLVDGYKIKLHSAEMRLQQAQHNLVLAQATYNAEKLNYEHAQATIAKFKADIALYEKHNSLIKRLREARPIIAARLWAIVLASVSSHFSEIRGTQSVVTRNASSFLVDGRPVAGVSGSTLDSLGLAMRIALTKTFLPSIDYLLLDEPASGMDDDRETSMLGLLAATGYSQVVVVTHSNLADSFASNIIQL